MSDLRKISMKQTTPEKKMSNMMIEEMKNSGSKIVDLYDPDMF